MHAERAASTCARLACIGLACALAGCSQTMPDRPARMTRGYVYYLDGAGGGGLLRNWSGGVKQGLLEAGYNGAGEVFHWNTGLGVVADQDASVEYKRSKAAELAKRIRQYTREHPQAPVTLIGLSAGTAVLVFTLEALPADCQVDSVILLGASISANHDLTQALQHVRNRMYVFTSQKDAVLAYLVPAAGTADRQKGVDSAGLRGFWMPPAASTETRAQYAKVSNIPWRPEFEAVGDRGRHTDTVKASFVQAYIAPLVMQAGAHGVSSPTTAVPRVPNPDYDRWARFEPGSWSTLEGHQLVNGVRRPVRITSRLLSKHQDKVVIERTYRMLDAGEAEPLRVQTFVAASQIAPQEHPATSDNAHVISLPTTRMPIAGQTLDCEVRRIEAKGQFPEWGRDVTSRVCTNRRVPGEIVKIWIQFHKEDEAVEFDGQVVAYEARSAAPG